LLANFAAGAFMIILRPIKAGDFVTAGGDTGTVKEIGPFRYRHQYAGQGSGNRWQRKNFRRYYPELFHKPVPAR
jgi:hypothetical protein